MVDILFVCRGNTCRSPMAEGLARHMLGDQVYVESAGISPGGSNAAAEAVNVLLQQYGVDISTHRPRAVSGLPLDMFEKIVALDPSVYDDLSSLFPRIRARLLRWDIRDPYHQGLDDYVRAAAEIEHEIRALAKDLDLTVSEP